MRMSDLIEEFIKDLFDGNEEIEIQRNELAEHVHVVLNEMKKNRYSVAGVLKSEEK